MHAACVRLACCVALGILHDPDMLAWHTHCTTLTVSAIVTLTLTLNVTVTPTMPPSIAEPHLHPEYPPVMDLPVAVPPSPDECR